jgi:large subunit ribosomal protein L4
MEIAVLNIEGQEVDHIELPADIFEANINRGLMHQALVRQLANARRGTHKAKTRGEVNYSTSKMYRQKGTGRARHGSRKAPIFVGGGKAHGPQPRSYRKKMPRQMRHAALRSALSVKAQAGDIVVLDELTLAAPKTREMVTIMKRVAGDGSVLVLMPERNENVELSTRNLSEVKTLRASYLNIRDLLGFDKIVLPLAALDVIGGFLGREKEIYVLATDGEAAEYEEE